MTPNEHSGRAQAASTPNALSLVDVVAYVWRWRWLVVALTSAAVAVGVAWIFLFPSYRSEGLFQFGGAISDPRMTDYAKELDDEPPPGLAIPDPAKELDNEPRPGLTIPDYRRYSTVYLTRERFEEFVQGANLADDEAANEIRKAFDTGGIAHMLQPIRQDGKPLDLAKDTGGNVTALRISARAPSPALAQEMVSLLARYVVDSIVLSLFSAAVPAQHADLRTSLVVYDHLMLRNATKQEELKRRVESLKDIVDRYPSAANVAPSRMASSRGQTRYFSPLDLLVTAEIDEIDTRAEARWLQQRHTQAAILMEYLDRVRTLLAKTKTPSGEQLLKEMETIREEMFQKVWARNLEVEVVKEAYNAIAIANQRAADEFLQKSRFVAGPTQPARPTARPVLVLLLALVLGLVFSFLLVFARQWWSVNRPMIYGSR